MPIRAKIYGAKIFDMPGSSSSSKIDFSQVISALKDGKTLLLLDDSVSPHTGSLVTPAAFATEESIAKLLNFGSGTLIAAVAESRSRELGLTRMCESRSPDSFDFLTSVEARNGVHSGISASDRAQTLKTLATTGSPSLDLVTPGHIFPVRVKDGGALVRHAIPEGSVDLMRLAGLPLTAAVALCLNKNGLAASPDELKQIAADSGAVITLRLSDIVRYRLNNETHVEEIAVTSLPTALGGDFSARCFRSVLDGSEHLVLQKGSPSKDKPVLIRMHSAQLFNDLFGGLRSSKDSDVTTGSPVIRGALRELEKQGAGIFVYLQHKREGRLEKELEKMKARDSLGISHVQLREIGLGAQILRFLGVQKIRLLTNSVRAVSGLEGFGLEIVEQVGFQEL